MTYPFVRAQRVEGVVEELARLVVLALLVDAPVVVGVAASAYVRTYLTQLSIEPERGA